MAKIHMVELVPFVLVLWVLVANFGIVGAAIAWTLRAACDSLAMFYAAEMAWSRLRRLAVPLLVVIGAVLFNCLPHRAALTASSVGALLMVVLLAWAYKSSPAQLTAPLHRLLRRFAWTAR